MSEIYLKKEIIEDKLPSKIAADTLYIVKETDDNGDKYGVMYVDVDDETRLPIQDPTKLSPNSKELVGKFTPTNGEIFNDYDNNIGYGEHSHTENVNNRSFGLGSHTEGYGNSTGTMAFSIINYSKENKCYEIDVSENFDTSILLNKEFSVNNNYKVGIVSNIVDNTLFVSEYIDLEGTDNYLWFPDDTSLGNIALFGTWSHTEGNNNLNLGESSSIRGINNKLITGSIINISGSGNEMTGLNTYVQVIGSSNNLKNSNSTTILGYDNDILEYSRSNIVIGSNNILGSVSETLILGKNIKASHIVNNPTLILGKYNREIENVPFIIGNGKSDTERYNPIMITDKNSILFNSELEDVTEIGENNIIIGAKNYSKGNNAIIFGKNIQNFANLSFLFGEKNNNEGNNSFIFGSANTNKNGRSYIFGMHNNNNNDDSILLGKYLYSSTDEQIILGKYNAENPNALFIIGTGSNDSIKMNALEVLKDGTVEIKKSGSSLNSLVNKEYIDSAVAWIKNNNFVNVKKYIVESMDNLNAISVSSDTTIYIVTRTKEIYIDIDGTRIKITDNDKLSITDGGLVKGLLEIETNGTTDKSVVSRKVLNDGLSKKLNTSGGIINGDLTIIGNLNFQKDDKIVEIITRDDLEEELKKKLDITGGNVTGDLSVDGELSVLINDDEGSRYSKVLTEETLKENLSVIGTPVDYTLNTVSNNAIANRPVAVKFNALENTINVLNIDTVNKNAFIENVDETNDKSIINKEYMVEYINSAIAYGISEPSSSLDPNIKLYIKVDSE